MLELTWPFAMQFLQLLSEVQQAQILLDTCVFASTPARPEADSGTEYSGGAGRRILVGNPPPRPPFGCIVSSNVSILHAVQCKLDSRPSLLTIYYYIILPPFLNICLSRDFNKWLHTEQNEWIYTLKYVYIHPYVVVHLKSLKRQIFRNGGWFQRRAAPLPHLLLLRRRITWLSVGAPPREWGGEKEMGIVSGAS